MSIAHTLRRVDELEEPSGHPVPAYDDAKRGSRPDAAPRSFDPPGDEVDIGHGLANPRQPGPSEVRLDRYAAGEREAVGVELARDPFDSRDVVGIKRGALAILKPRCVRT
jgi:hypothetical protein